MRLLRLVSPSQSDITTSEWTNYFNDNLILKPNSKIGLLNASIPINLKTITIDNTNDTFKFKTADKNEEYYDINLTHGSYSIQDFINHFLQEANSALDINTTSDVGFSMTMIAIEETDGDHLELTISRHKTDDFKQYINSSNKITVDNKTLVRNPADDDTAFLLSSLPILFTCSFIRAKIIDVDDLILGLTNKYEGSASLTDGLLTYGIGIKTNPDDDEKTYYFINSDGETEFTEYIPQENEIISIEISNGSVNYCIYDIDEVITIIRTIPAKTNILETFNPVIALRGATASCSLPRLIYDSRFQIEDDNIIISQAPRKTYLLKNMDLDIVNEISAVPEPPKDIGNTIFELIFSKLGIQNTMGFTSPILRFKGTETTFTATSSINELVIPKNLIVEIQDLYLDTMDAGLGKRRNILAIIPQLFQRENNLIYECTSTPIMLDLFNAYEMNLRSLRIRILTRSDENDILIDISDQIELTLLLD